MFLLLRVINRGNLRSAGISRFIAKPLRSYRFPSLASASFGHLLFTLAGHTRLLLPRSAMFHQGPLGSSDARLVTSLSLSSSMLSETPGGRVSLVSNALPVSPALTSKRSAHSQNSIFSGLRGRFRAHTLHLAGLAFLLFLGYLASGWLTKPCPGGLQCPSQLRTSARFVPMFDVRRSSFKTTLYGINITCERLQNSLALVGQGSSF